MRIGIVAHGSEAVIRECPGPLPGGACPLVASKAVPLPCAGQDLLLRLRVVGKPRNWLFTVANDTEGCPVYQLDGGLGTIA